MDFEFQGNQQNCNFCSQVFYELIPNPVTLFQARALSTILCFEDDGSSVSKEEVEAKYLHATPCDACQEWVTEAESVVQEWEHILDKIRTIGFRLKQIIQCGEQLYLQRSKAKKKGTRYTRDVSDEIAIAPEECRGPEEQNTRDLPLEVQLNVKDEDDTDYVQEDDCEEYDLNPEESDPEWLPASEEETSVHPSGNTKSPYVKPRSFTGVQKAVLFQQYEIHKALLWNTRYDDDESNKRAIWTDVAAAVASVEPGSDPNEKLCWKTLQPIIRKETEEQRCTYTHETTGGPVKLKYLKIELIRCEDPGFAGHGYLRKRRYETYSDNAKIERLCKKARRQKEATVGITTKKRKGRPIKYGDEEGTNGPMEPCFAEGCKFSSSDPDRLAGHYRQKHLKDRHGYKCREPNCDKAFGDFRRLVIHRSAHKGQYFFTCQHCGKGFVRSESLHEHIILRHTENPPKYSCDHCSRSYFLESRLTQHIRNIHSTKLSRCTVTGCNFSCRGVAPLKYHRLRAHPDKFPNLKKSKQQEREICDECGMTFSCRKSFRRHQLVHEGVSVEVLKPHACSYEGCQYRSESKRALKKHIIIVHETTEKNFPCTFPNCTRRFKTPCTVKSHIKKVHEKNPAEKILVACSFCDMKLCSTRGLQNHIATQHTTGNKNDFVCNRCNRGFPTKKYFRRHQIQYPNCEPVQIGKDAILCEICNKYCSNLAGFKRHNHLVHNSELRPWECQKCGKTFPIKMYLMRHERESKNCVPRNQTHSNNEVEHTDPGPGQSPVLPKRVEVNVETTVSADSVNEYPGKVINTQTEGSANSKLQRKQVTPKGKILVHRENEAKLEQKLVDIPVQQHQQSQMQQDFYFAFYGYQG